MVKGRCRIIKLPCIQVHAMETGGEQNNWGQVCMMHSLEMCGDQDSKHQQVREGQPDRGGGWRDRRQCTEGHTKRIGGEQSNKRQHGKEDCYKA